MLVGILTLFSLVQASPASPINITRIHAGEQVLGGQTLVQYEFGGLQSTIVTRSGSINISASRYPQDSSVTEIQLLQLPVNTQSQSFVVSCETVTQLVKQADASRTSEEDAAILPCINAGFVTTVPLADGTIFKQVENVAICPCLPTVTYDVPQSTDIVVGGKTLRVAVPTNLVKLPSIQLGGNPITQKSVPFSGGLSLLNVSVSVLAFVAATYILLLA